MAIPAVAPGATPDGCGFAVEDAEVEAEEVADEDRVVHARSEKALLESDCLEVGVGVGVGVGGGVGVSVALGSTNDWLDVIGGVEGTPGEEDENAGLSMIDTMRNWFLVNEPAGRPSYRCPTYVNAKFAHNHRTLVIFSKAS
ncbi:hypothetical protein K4F52_008794 [Lecanicillium sp. MT-2017a]|nr:hypothetical protein K4F52_008794 [Lecanicillium sp. MT-2017a]